MNYSLVAAFNHQTSATVALDWFSNILVTATGEGVVSLIDTEEGNFLRHHHCFKYGVKALRFFHTSDVAAVSSGSVGDAAWRLWDFTANKFFAVFRGHPEHVEYLAVHPREDLILSSSGCSSVLWDVRSDKVIQRFEGEQGLFERNQGRYFVLSQKKQVSMFDVRKSDKAFFSFSVGRSLNTFDLNPDNSKIAIATDQALHLYDTIKGTCLGSTTKVKDAKSVSFNWSGDQLACSQGNRIDITENLQIKQTIADHEGPTKTLFSPNRDLLATTSTGIGLWTPLLS